jgi:hypothetical protein
LSIALCGCTEHSPLPTQTRLVPDAALASATGNATTAVSATLADADPTIAPSLQITSDGGGVYKNSNSLVSVIQSIGDFVLDSYNAKNSTRTIHLDFSRPIAGSGVDGGDAVGIPSGNYKFHLISKCHLYGNSFLTIAAGATMTCPLHIGGIYVGTQEYAVQMNPYVSAADTAWAETNYANVACNSAAMSCASWTLTPSGTAPDGSRANVAALLSYQRTTAKGKTTTTIVKQGDFWMSFRIGVTNP